MGNSEVKGCYYKNGVWEVFTELKEGGGGVSLVDN